ncbi:TBPIP-domain-containing protein [Cutaneotrichosporon oleaginosum]|uniref:TBPIP-domain-containing protein n=1 Tax=Cutaneotrichosporon oleaginosum TaxID=879819 RepID=A0A0J0XF58_9TREE|nr:TBPIP-domain-containing protein [Cutaneotrichosporon oleaginosum]KLT39710.1 TBPIP-domain-containing protein [Cutaneotrichosporon oleaginosum]
MPPKAATKEKPLKGEEAEQMVLEYLRSVNRPYASTDVSANLKNRVTKTEAQKALNALAEKGHLTLKPYGKQTIFVFNQSQLPVLDPHELLRLDDQLKDVKATLDERRKNLKSLQSDLASLEALPKTQDLSKQIGDVTVENELTLNSLKAFRGESAVAPMSAKDMVQIDADWEHWRKEWTSRKKVYKDIYTMLTDCGLAPASQVDFEEEQGVEGDDEDTKVVEAGEFCQPAGHVSVKRRQPSSVGKPGHTSSAKRART